MLRDFFSDEKKEASVIYKDGFENTEFNSYQAHLIARYLTKELGYSKAKVKTFLIKFSGEHDKNFNYIGIREQFKIILKNLDGEWRDKSKPIYITENELIKIRELPNYNAQKLMLGFLVFAKRDGGYVYRNRWTDIKSIMALRITNDQVNAFIHMAYKRNMIRDSNEHHFMKFMDNTSEIRIEIKDEKDLYNLEKSYNEYCGGILGYCRECGNEFLKSARANIYCNICSGKREKKKYERYNKSRTVG